MAKKPGKHQRNKQRCQDLGWKIHDREKSFVLHSYTTHELRITNTFLLVRSSGRSKQLLRFAHGQGQKANKNLQQKPLSGFITMPLCSMFRTLKSVRTRL